MRNLIWRAEALLLRAALAGLGRLSPRRSARLVGVVLAAVGPLLPVSRVATANLRLARPMLDDAARRRIVRDVWRHLGQTMGELPHLHRLPIAVEGAGLLRDLAAEGGPAILFSGHVGNWEMLPVACARQGVLFAPAYRAIANPHVDRLVAALRARAIGRAVPMFPKGSAGARGALRHLAGGGFLGLLMDQKLNEGIEVPFFGHGAMTAPALASLALRFRCPVVPGHVERLGPGELRLVVEPPLPLPDTGDRQADIATLTRAVNARLERWIADRPADWLWLHRRWPKTLYRRGIDPGPDRPRR